jgi:ATP-dependent helicase HepA
MKQPLPGQRWVSDSEPELGLGIILEAGFGRVEVLFPAANERRQYALKSAPLRRVEFAAGDRVKIHDGRQVVVESVEEEKGMLIYHGAGGRFTEAELSDKISFSKPEDRLLVGQVDDLREFDLRLEALERRCAARKSPVRGFLGGRVSLIPHQMFIASEVTSRLAPRVLLADEVGLGKTIEAGLILHRLHLTGRAERVLILVPEPLIHQWFVELLRRFNLLFSIFDEERCEAIEKLDEEENPFLDSQLVICSVGLLAGDERRARQVLEAGWDLLVVDEAHHLEWSATAPSPQYQLVAALAARTSGLLLLTATPQQLGVEGHFARLRLLDPDRYASLEDFLAEAEHYEEVAKAVDRLLAGKALTKKETALFAAKSPRIRARCEALAAGDAGARELLMADLLDAFGTGRVMFRNTRAALSGFPERRALLVPLEGVNENEAKVKWLVGLLKELGEEKVLLICKTRALAEQVSTDLQRQVNVKCAVFHEGLTLLQRDRHAAYFSEEEGARILICSEIGSEGRNFQFAHHLVLFDLPENPELVEQRIGRLDRIGQTDLIKIHVPYLKGSAGEVLARWYHEGLDAFEHNLHGAAEIVRTLGAELTALVAEPEKSKLTAFLRTTKECRAGVVRKLGRGHDRLLELNSCRVEQAAATIENIRTLDGDAALEPFALRLFEQIGMHIEELGNRTYLFRPDALRTDALPSLPAEGQSMTFERNRALSREDLGFLTWDHPLMRGALDGLLGTEAGNSAFAVWRDGGRETILLEACFIAECAAPTALHVDRFLPLTPIRVVVDHALADLSTDAELAEANFEKGDVFRLLDRGAVKKKLLPAMLEKTRALAAERLAELVQAATATMAAQFSHELQRLRDLAEINDHVRPAEIAATEQQQADLATALAASHLRLDAVRLIFRMP